MRAKLWLRAGVLFALSNLGCSSSDEDGQSGATCPNPEPRLTATPTFEPASIPVGQVSEVTLTVPVTDSAQRVIVQMSQVSAGSAVVNGPLGQADNAGCNVTVPLSFAADLPAGQYFPALTVSAGADGSLGVYVDYSYQAGVSTSNYAMITPPPVTVSDSKIPIPFIELK